MSTLGNSQVEPGVYRSMPDADYRAIDALSNSDLMAWAKGEGANTIDPRNAVFGTAFHAIVLEPDVASAKLVGLEPKQKRKDYDGPEDALVLTNSDYKKLMGCYDSVKEHPQLGKLMEMARADRDRCELVVVWIDELTGIKCKAKIDQVTDNYVWDWKTTNSDPDGFGYSIGAFMYHVQAAHYLIGAKACSLGPEKFRFACASKRADKGHVCWVQDVDTSLMCAGFKTREILMSLYAQHGKEQTNENL